jgi:branched-chain amino acid transport system permease protein
MMVRYLSALLGLALLPLLFGSEPALAVLSTMAIAALFAMSYNLLLGEGGMISFGHSVYFGLGGYVAIHAIAAAAQPGWWLPVPLMPLIGACAGLVFGGIFGYVCTRHSGLAFPMITLGIVELVGTAALMLDLFFGSDLGVAGDRTAGPALFGFSLKTRLHVYYCILAWGIVAFALLRFYTRTPLGRLANAVRDNPERCAFIGFSPARVRYLTFIVSATFAGLAGALSAINVERMTPDSITLAASGMVLLMTYIGGTQHFWGPAIGAAVLQLANSVLSDYTDLWLLYVGLFFIAVVLWLPGGIAGLAVGAWRRAFGR